MPAAGKEDGRDATYFRGDEELLYTAPDNRFLAGPRLHFAPITMEQMETKRTWREFTDEEWAEWERRGGMSKAAWQAANEVKQRQHRREMGDRRARRELQRQRDLGRAPY